MSSNNQIPAPHNNNMTLHKLDDVSQYNTTNGMSALTFNLGFSGAISSDFYCSEPLSGVVLSTGGNAWSKTPAVCKKFTLSMYKLQFFKNSPVIPAQHLTFHEIQFKRPGHDVSWPTIYYKTVNGQGEADREYDRGLGSRDFNDPTSTEVVVQDHLGLYNVIRFSQGLASTAFLNYNSTLPPFYVQAVMAGTVHIYNFVYHMPFPMLSFKNWEHGDCTTTSTYIDPQLGEHQVTIEASVLVSLSLMPDATEPELIDISIGEGYTYQLLLQPGCSTPAFQAVSVLLTGFAVKNTLTLHHVHQKVHLQWCDHPYFNMSAIPARPVYESMGYSFYGWFVWKNDEEESVLRHKFMGKLKKPLQNLQHEKMKRMEKKQLQYLEELTSIIINPKRLTKYYQEMDWIKHFD